MNQDKEESLKQIMKDKTEPRKSLKDIFAKLKSLNSAEEKREQS
jgi:hypothetical protein